MKNWSRDQEGNSYRANCPRCCGSGQVTCGACDGAGRLVWYKVVVATFKTVFDDYIFMVFLFMNFSLTRNNSLLTRDWSNNTKKPIEDEKTDMDDDVIHAATGDSIMFSAGKRVCSISQFDPDEIAKSSQRLVGIHKGLNNGKCNLWRMTHVSGYGTGKWVHLWETAIRSCIRSQIWAWWRERKIFYSGKQQICLLRRNGCHKEKTFFFQKVLLQPFKIILLNVAAFVTSLDASTTVTSATAALFFSPDSKFKPTSYHS